MFTETTNAHDIIDQLDRVTCPGDLLPIIRNEAGYVSGRYSTGLSAHLDYVEQDRRICIDWNVKYDHFTYRILTGYNAEKNMWEYYGREERIEFTTKRGLKKMQDFIKDMAQLDYGLPGRLFTAYRDANRAAGWKTY